MNPRAAAVTAVAVAADLLVFTDLLLPLPEPVHTPAWIVVGWALAGGVVLALRARRPLAVHSALVLHAVLGALLMSYRPVVLVCVAVAAVAARYGWRQTAAAFLATTVACVAWVINEVRTEPGVQAPATIVLLGVIYLALPLAAVGVGRWQRSGLMQRRDLERRRAEEARAAVAAERSRIARELHDIVSHAVGVIVIQAAGARAVLPRDPSRAAQAMAAIEETGVQAVDELRRLLAILRPPDGPADPDAAVPPPGLADLEPLLASARAAGVDVRVCEEGPSGRLDPSVDLAGYRVVQESLTNVVKHAGSGATATVRLTWDEGSVRIAVEDDGTASGATHPLSTGHGLAGLAERVHLAEGVLSTGGSVAGGFRVEATLPRASPGRR